MTAATKNVEQAFSLAKERYAELGVDTDEALDRLARIPISLHCWQGDDVGGFENAGEALGGGPRRTGNYPGKARTADELRGDLDKALSLIPGTHRLNLHASYAETGGKPVDRDELEPAHFTGWIDWAKSNRMGMDFNPTYFSHPKAADGFTLAHPDEAIRRFWIDHGIACRKIGAAIGEALGTPCVTNVWIPDGMKDLPVDRKGPASGWPQSLDEIFAEPIDPELNLDAVESKLFGIGSETYVVGSHEFYLGYALSRKKLLCLDAGHFHPTETIADKISSALLFVDEILLHVSRGVRWDSDHVVILTDELRGHRRGDRPRRLPRPRPHRAGLLRRQHQPRRRLGDRHAGDAQGAACWPCSSRSTCSESSRPRRLHVAAGAAGGAEDAALRRGLGQVPRQSRDPRRPRLARRRQEIRGRRVEQAGVEKPSQSCFSPRENVPRRGG